MSAIEIKIDLAFMNTEEKIALFRFLEYREKKKIKKEKKGKA